MSSQTLELMKAAATTIGDRTAPITCWMNGDFDNLRKHWLVLVNLEDSPFCYLLLREDEDHQIQFHLSFANEDACHVAMPCHVDALTEGIKILINFKLETAEDVTGWCSDWFLIFQRKTALDENLVCSYLLTNYFFLNFASPFLNICPNE